MTNIAVNPNITNCNKRFYAGMTLKDAKQSGVDKCFFRRDFHNLDKDKDGVLSAEEIIKERNRDAKFSLLSGILIGAWGIYDAIHNKGFSRYLWGGLDASITAYSFCDAHKINKETKEMEKQLAAEKSLNEEA